MKKIWFDGCYHMLKTYDVLHNKLEQLIEEESQLEFWFRWPLTNLQAYALDCLIKTKYHHPQRNIEIVAVLDQLKYAGVTLEYLHSNGMLMQDRIRPEEMVKDITRIKAVTRIEFAPLPEGVSPEFDPDNWSYRDEWNYSNKIDAWAKGQCNLLVAFHYQGIPNRWNLAINRIQRKGKPEVISIFNQEIATRISELAKALEGDESLVFKGRAEGKSFNAIAQEMKIPVKMASQLFRRAEAIIVTQLFDEFDLDDKPNQVEGYQGIDGQKFGLIVQRDFKDISEEGRLVARIMGSYISVRRVEETVDHGEGLAIDITTAQGVFENVIFVEVGEEVDTRNLQEEGQKVAFVTILPDSEEGTSIRMQIP